MSISTRKRSRRGAHARCCQDLLRPLASLNHQPELLLEVGTVCGNVQCQIQVVGYRPHHGVAQLGQRRQQFIVALSIVGGAHGCRIGAGMDVNGRLLLALCPQQRQGQAAQQCMLAPAPTALIRCPLHQRRIGKVHQGASRSLFIRRPHRRYLSRGE